MCRVRENTHTRNQRRIRQNYSSYILMGYQGIKSTVVSVFEMEKDNACECGASLPNDIRNLATIFVLNFRSTLQIYNSHPGSSIVT